MREELIIRNVVRMVELPQSQREAIEPWTAEEARCFLLASRKHPCTQHSSCWFCTVAPRRNAGAAPGRADIGSDSGTIHVRPQLQHFGAELAVGPVKIRV